MSARLLTTLRNKYKNYSYAKLAALAIFLSQIAQVIDPDDRAAARPVSGLIRSVSDKLQTLAPTIPSIMSTTSG